MAPFNPTARQARPARPIRTRFAAAATAVPAASGIAFILLVALTLLGSPGGRAADAPPGPNPGATATATASADGFQPLFDGRTLAGWAAPEMGWWSVEEGAITGRITRERPCSTNQYLVWQGGELADFELKLESRLSGEGGINNGFQFRSRVLPDGDVAGYQMDNNLGTDWLVRLYDEFGRHTLAWRGKQTVFDSDGKATTTDLPGADGPAWFQLGEWHEYHLICDGPRLVLHVDGRLAAQVEDHDRRRADPQGALALQLHSGPPTLVQFRNIRLRILRPTPPPAPPPPSSETRRRELLHDADAFWDFGVGGHMARRPLRYVGSLEDFEFNVRPDGPAARPDSRVTLLRGGWFDAGTGIVTTNGPFTVWIRARDPQGTWDGTLIARQDGSSSRGFALSGSQGKLRFEIATDTGRVSAEFPVTDLDARAWHDLVGRYDGQVLTLHGDGKERARAPVPGPILTGEGPLLVGARPENGKGTHLFRGELEGAALWIRPLSPREIRRLSPDSTAD